MLGNINQYEMELSKASDKALPLSLLMQGYNCTSSEEFFVETFKQVRTSELEETLLLLPYSVACDILQRLPNLLKNDYNAELLVRLALCLIQAHHSPIVANQNLLPTLDIVKKLAVEKISTLRGMIGFNLHGMMYVQCILEEQEGIKFFRDL